MKKEEYIQRYGQAAYGNVLQQRRDWHVQHREEDNARNRDWKATHPKEVKAAAARWRAAHPEQVKATNQEVSRKRGIYYDHTLEYNMDGLRHERNLVRLRHRKQYHDITQATPNSVLHDEWIYGTAKYRGLALVEKVPHQNGIIKPIIILEGEIALFTEKGIREQK